MKVGWRLNPGGCVSLVLATLPKSMATSCRSTCIRFQILRSEVGCGRFGAFDASSSPWERDEFHVAPCGNASDIQLPEKLALWIHEEGFRDDGRLQSSRIDVCHDDTFSYCSRYLCPTHECDTPEQFGSTLQIDFHPFGRDAAEPIVSLTIGFSISFIPRQSSVSEITRFGPLEILEMDDPSNCQGTVVNKSIQSRFDHVTTAPTPKLQNVSSHVRVHCTASSNLSTLESSSVSIGFPHLPASDSEQSKARRLLAHALIPREENHTESRSSVFLPAPTSLVVVDEPSSTPSLSSSVFPSYDRVSLESNPSEKAVAAPMHNPRPGALRTLPPLIPFRGDRAGVARNDTTPAPYSSPQRSSGIIVFVVGVFLLLASMAILINHVGRRRNLQAFERRPASTRAHRERRTGSSRPSSTGQRHLNHDPNCCNDWMSRFKGEQDKLSHLSTRSILTSEDESGEIIENRSKSSIFSESVDASQLDLESDPFEITNDLDTTEAIDSVLIVDANSNLRITVDEVSLTMPKKSILDESASEIRRIHKSSELIKEHERSSHYFSSMLRASQLLSLQSQDQLISKPWKVTTPDVPVNPRVSFHVHPAVAVEGCVDTKVLQLLRNAYAWLQNIYTLPSSDVSAVVKSMPSLPSDGLVDSECVPDSISISTFSNQSSLSF